MVNVGDLLQMSYYELSPFTGSDGAKRYRIEKITEEPSAEGDDGEPAEPVKRLQVSLWYTPFAYDHTPREEMILHTEEFSYEGLTEIVKWLNSQTVPAS